MNEEIVLRVISMCVGAEQQKVPQRMKSYRNKKKCWEHGPKKKKKAWE